MGMSEMKAQIKGMGLAQYPDQFRGDTLGKNSRNLGSQTYDLHMGDGSQLAKKPVDLFIAQGQRITAGDEDVADCRRVADILHTQFPPGSMPGSLFPAHQAGTGTIAAVG
jgi:hypothetical protein